MRFASHADRQPVPQDESPTRVRVAVCLLLAGCITNRIGPGALVSMTQQQERRDPNPTAPIIDTPMQNVWAPEQRPPAPGSRSELIQRSIASIAAIAAGAMPAIVWSGTFDENRVFEKSPEPAEPTPAAEP